MLITKNQLKDALISILIGAVVAFVTALLQGLLDWLRGVDFITGPGAGIGIYLAKASKWWKHG